MSSTFNVDPDLIPDTDLEYPNLTLYIDLNFDLASNLDFELQLQP